MGPPPLSVSTPCPRPPRRPHLPQMAYEQQLRREVLINIERMRAEELGGLEVGGTWSWEVGWGWGEVTVWRS